MEFIGFGVTVLLGVCLILVGLVVAYISGMGFGVTSKWEALYGLIPITIGIALLYYACIHSPFQLVVKHVYI